VNGIAFNPNFAVGFYRGAEHARLAAILAAGREDGRQPYNGFFLI